jgi:hypothetical protein
MTTPPALPRTGLYHANLVLNGILAVAFCLSQKREVCETLRKAVPVTYLFLFYMEPLSPVSKGKTGEDGTGKPDYRNLGRRLISGRCLFWRFSGEGFFT